MKRLPLLTLTFSIAFAVFFIAPAFLSKQFGPYPLIKIGDLFDIFTPLVLIPLYWLLFRNSTDKAPGATETVTFFVLAALWVEGQGMHLAANSIGHLLKGMTGTDAYNLANFYDEVLSHYMWHVGVMGLSLLLVLRQWRTPLTKGQTAKWLPGLAGVIYGFTFFIIIIEGATTPLGVPFAALFTLFGLIWGRTKLKQQPLLLFSVAAYLTAVLFFAGWAIYWRGLPEFSQVGIID